MNYSILENMSTMNSSAPTGNNDYYMTPSSSGSAQRRIRTPHPHDVLCGRGGGINSHPGNRTFRDFVRERKNEYNLASNKAEKSSVAKEVINMVHSLSPPGRFLHRDPSGGLSGGFWVEIDELKALAKTSQALREGAPTIRAQHKDVVKKSARSLKRRAPEMTTSSAAFAATPLLSNAKFQAVYVSPENGSTTPTLMPSPMDSSPTPFLLNPPVAEEWKLNVAELNISEFVDPFVNEEETFQNLYGGKENVQFTSVGASENFPACAMCGLPLEQGRGCLCCSVQSENFSEVHAATPLLTFDLL